MMMMMTMMMMKKMMMMVPMMMMMMMPMMMPMLRETVNDLKRKSQGVQVKGRKLDSEEGISHETYPP